MLALLEPDPPSTWRDLIARWGIDVLDGYVIDLAVVPRDVVYRREAGVVPPMPPCGRR